MKLFHRHRNLKKTNTYLMYLNLLGAGAAKGEEKS